MPLNTLDGQLAPGNIDLSLQPTVKNKYENNAPSTVYSTSFSPDGKTEVLIPRVAHDGSGVLSEDEAKAQFYRTGKHLGIFNSPDSATRAAQKIHKDYETGAIKLKQRTPATDYSAPFAPPVPPPNINMQPQSIFEALRGLGQK